jgi:hypothetical protein
MGHDIEREGKRGLSRVALTLEEANRQRDTILAEKAARKSKDTNPKDAVGIKKFPISTVSGPVIAELGLAMLEGARKYGRHNYRDSGVRASVYVDAMFRHMMKWWEGEDIDPDSGLSHVTKIIASAFVLRDAMIFENWVDDRPPAVDPAIWKKMDKMAADIVEKYPNAKEPVTNESLK